VQRSLALRRLAYSNFADRPIGDNIITFGLCVKFDSKKILSRATAVAGAPCRAPLL
jgi:hypothetical protein